MIAAVLIGGEDITDDATDADDEELGLAVTEEGEVDDVMVVEGEVEEVMEGFLNSCWSRGPDSLGSVNWVVLL